MYTEQGGARGIARNFVKGMLDNALPGYLQPGGGCAPFFAFVDGFGFNGIQHSIWLNFNSIARCIHIKFSEVALAM